MEHTVNSAVHVQYKSDSTIDLLSLADLRKRFNELLDLCGGVIKMWGDPKAITARRGDDVPGIQVVIQRHGRQTREMANTNNLRLLTGCPRTYDLVLLPAQTFAQIVRQLFQVASDVLDAKTV